MRIASAPRTGAVTVRAQGPFENQQPILRSQIPFIQDLQKNLPLWKISPARPAMERFGLSDTLDGCTGRFARRHVGRLHVATTYVTPEVYSD